MENKWKAVLEKIKDKKGLPKKNQLLILLLAGILLVVIAIPAGDKKKPADASGKAANGRSADKVGSDSLTEEYEKYMENRVAKALEHVRGVGKTEVMITLRSFGQKIIEKDQQSNSQKSQEEDKEGGVRHKQDFSSDKTSIYEQGADGSQSPYVSKELTPEIAGVIVIADGGDNAVVVQNISEAIQALFGVEAHKIKIMKRTDT